MASLSVKNRVAMFETKSSTDEENPISPMGGSYKRPSTPTTKSFGKPTTPGRHSFGGTVKRPTTQNGQPKPESRNDSPKAGRGTWPWPPEERTIPAPTWKKADGNRRHSSPYISQSNGKPSQKKPFGNSSTRRTSAVSLPQRSPMGQSSAMNSPTYFPQRSPKAFNKVKASPLSTEKLGADYCAESISKPVILPSPKNKPVILPSPKHVSSPLARDENNVARDESSATRDENCDENKAPVSNSVSDSASQRSKALQLAKSRNSMAAKGENVPVLSDADEKSHEDGLSTTSSLRTDPELKQINENKLSSASTVSSYAQKRSTTPDSQVSDLKLSRSQSPMPGMRTGRASFSHKEARKALLQAAQKKKERAEAVAKRAEQESISQELEDEKKAVDNSARRAAERKALLQAAQRRKDKADEVKPKHAALGHDECQPSDAQENNSARRAAERKALLQAAQRKKDNADEVEPKHAALGHDECQPSDAQENDHQLQQADNTQIEHVNDGSDVKRSAGAADRLALKAANVLKIKNSSRLIFGDSTSVAKGSEEGIESHKDGEGSCSGSIVSTSSRLKSHPAFAARASPGVSSQVVRSVNLFSGATAGGDTAIVDSHVAKVSKPFSEELFSSFRQFNDTKTPSNPQEQQDPSDTKNQGRPPQAQPVQSPMYRSVTGGNGTTFQLYDSSQGSPRADINSGRLSMDSADSPFVPEESLHSTSERNFDRKWMESTGQPKYAGTRQSFQHSQEGGYLSSLSENTFSTMISSAQEPKQLSLKVGAETQVSTADLLTPSIQSMRSGFSTAHSIVSMSPRVDTSGGFQNSHFEYLMNTPPRHSNADLQLDPNGRSSAPSGVPSQIDEEEASAEPSVEVLPEANIGHSDTRVEETETTVVVVKDTITTNVCSTAKETIVPLLPSNSNTDAPPGYVFHDEDDEACNDRLETKRDPAGMSFEEALKQNCPGEKGVTFMEDAYRHPKIADKSNSTKDSASSSMHSGFSSVQHGDSSHGSTKARTGEQSKNGSDSPREGSKSIRSGLSGLQNSSDLEGSASMRSTSMKNTQPVENERDGNPAHPPAQKSVSVLPPPKLSKFDTIMEGEDEESSGFKDIQSPTMKNSLPQTSDTMHTESTTMKSTLPQTPGTMRTESATMKSALPQTPGTMRTESTAMKSTLPQTPGTMRTESTSMKSTLPQTPGTMRTESTTMKSTLPQTPATMHAEADTMQEENSDSGRKPMLPPHLVVNTRSDKGGEETNNVDDSPSSSKNSSKWKMKMPNIVKNVLAKASTPKSSQTPKEDQKRQKSTVSTSDDDDDDIFGGLEDELSKLMGEAPKKASSTKSATIGSNNRRTPKQPPSTPRRFFHSGHTRNTEPTPVVENKKDVPRRSVRSDTRSNTPSGRSSSTRRKTPLSLRSLKERLTSPRNLPSPFSAAQKPPTPSNNDRSGMEVVEHQMENVNSDITSSVLGGAVVQKNGCNSLKPLVNEVTEETKTPKTKLSTTVPTSTKSTSKTPKIDNQSISDQSKKSKFSKGKDTLLDDTAFGSETMLDEETKATNLFEGAKSKSEEEDVADEQPSMFSGFGCGISDAWTVMRNVCHFGNKEEEPEVTAMAVDEETGTFISASTNNSSSHLTDLEKRVWSEWDKLDSALHITPKEASTDTRDEQAKKREVARGKLLEIANSAISSQMTKEGEHSVSYTTGSSSSRTGGYTATSSEEQTEDGGESRSYFSGSDMHSDLLSSVASSRPPPTANPILLSFSQRSLIEKFSKQLANHGVEVLKLNRRNQWQLRYFTVSKEQVALVAHEGNNKSSAEVAQCPKALLWLKKFSSKSGGYSLTHIDKSGHGGMLLVDLKDVQVSTKQDFDNSLPKKLLDKFKDSVLVTLEYEFKKEKRSIEFRCKDNDEAQFLCACIRVIRDLLKREQALRLKTQKKK